MKFIIKMGNEKEIRWGFIGCGEVTEKKSGPAFSKIEGSKVVAVMSRSHEKASSYAHRHHISRWYTDAQQLIEDPEVNAVYIATPPSSHATYAIMAMKAGKPVYVEKPLASSYIDCQRINRVCEQTGVPCFIAYYRRYLPYFQKVKQLIHEGAIGQVVNVQIRFAVPPRDLDYNSTNLPWRVQRDIAGGGYFYDLAPHQIDLCRTSLAPLSMPRASAPTVADFIRRKIPSAPRSSSTTDCPAADRGALSATRARAQTASSLSATKARYASPYSHTTPLPCTTRTAERKYTLKTPSMSRCRSLKAWCAICKERRPARQTT